MKLILENIGMLERAEITLHRLCVIAGENDNGKSTVGKIIFCIVKAINRYKEDLQESKEYLIEEKINEIFFLLRSSVKKNDAELLEMTRGLLSNVRHRMNAQEQLKLVNEAIKVISSRHIPRPERIVGKPFDRTDKDPLIQAQDLRDEIEAILNQPDDINKSIENALNKVFTSEFDASLLLQGPTEGSIQLFDRDLSLIHLLVSDRGVKLQGDVEPIVLKDATFIDTPLILNNHDVLMRSQTLLDLDQRNSARLGLSYTTLHTKDLFDKLRTPILPMDAFAGDKADVIGSMQDIIKGEIAYDRSTRDFVYRRKGAAISIKNTASGIKVFGLLQILVANDFVGKNTVLIFDEPENHLHPKWQLKLAQVLLKLTEKGVYVVVSSHSPYLIEALKRGVDRAGAASEARFALAQHRTIQDEDRLSDIFEVLAEPFEEFRQMDAEDLRDE